LWDRYVNHLIDKYVTDNAKILDAGFKNIKIKKGRNIAEYKQGIGKYIQKIIWLEIHAIAFKDDDL